MVRRTPRLGMALRSNQETIITPPDQLRFARTTELRPEFPINPATNSSSEIHLIDGQFHAPLELTVICNPIPIDPLHACTL